MQFPGWLGGGAMARLLKLRCVFAVLAGIMLTSSLVPTPADATVWHMQWAAPANTYGWCAMVGSAPDAYCYSDPGSACNRLEQWVKTYDNLTNDLGYTDGGTWNEKFCRWADHWGPVNGQVFWYCVSGTKQPPGLCVTDDIPSRASRDGGAGQCRVCTPHPISIISGAKTFTAEDFSDTGGLSLSRTFNSNPAGYMQGNVVRPTRGLASWAFDFAFELHLPNWSSSSQTAGLLSPRGSSYLFSADASGNVTALHSGNDVSPQNDYTLKYNGAWPSNASNMLNFQSNWILQDAQDRIWYLQSFKDPSSGKYDVALPVRMVDPGGRELAFGYGPTSELLSITDSNGNTISFDWLWATVPVAISAAHLPGGQTINYVYETLLSGGQNPDRLIRVEYHDASGSLKDQATYVYGDVRFPLFVTAIEDSAGTVRWSVTYDDQGRATSSSGPSGTDQYTVAYTPIGSTFTRTVTNALGKVATYNFTAPSGFGFELASVTTAATANTPPTTISMGWATDYSLSTATDAQGRTTGYTRDAADRPTQVVEAQGTAQARTTGLTWRSDYNRPTQVVQPGLTTNFTYTAGSSAVATAPPLSGHRYWRVRTSTTTSSGYFGMAELQLRTTAGGSNIATGKPSFASATASNTYATPMALDGNASTFWTTGATTPPSGGHWFAVDLQSSLATVKEVVITVRPDSSREDPLNLFVDWSDDNSAWTNQWSIPSILTWTAGQTRTFDGP